MRKAASLIGAFAVAAALPAVAQAQGPRDPDINIRIERLEQEIQALRAQTNDASAQATKAAADAAQANKAVQEQTDQTNADGKDLSFTIKGTKFNVYGKADVSLDYVTNGVP